MTNRREFLQIGVTATAWPIVARAAHAAGIDDLTPSTTPLSAVVYDRRFAQGVAFAERMAALGIAAYAIDGDMTRLWYDELHHRWQQSPSAIAGLTAHGPLFCFAELARDVRMRVVFRAEHRPDGGGIAHAVTGPVPMLAAASSACGRPATLGAAMADVVTQCPRGRSEIASTSLTSGATMLVGDVPDVDALYTWVIAPAVRG